MSSARKEHAIEKHKRDEDFDRFLGEILAEETDGLKEVDKYVDKVKKKVNPKMQKEADKWDNEDEK